LELNLKELPTTNIADKISKDFGKLEYLTEGFKKGRIQIKRNKK